MEDDPHTTREATLPAKSSPSLTEWARAMMVELERLSIHYPRTDMDRSKWLELFHSFGADLVKFSIGEIRTGCIHWRQNGERFFPTPGQLMDAIRKSTERQKPVGRPTPSGQHQPWGGDCQCDRCRDKTPREGFYRASPEEHAAANRLERDLAYRDEMRLEPSKFDDDEMRLRNQLINDLVLNTGMNRETARMKVMLERTKILYPDNRFAQKAVFSEKEGVVMTPALFAREEMLAAERIATLERRLHERHN